MRYSALGLKLGVNLERGFIVRTFIVVFAAAGLIATGVNARSVRSGSNNIVVKSSVPSNIGVSVGGASSLSKHQTLGASSSGKSLGRTARAKKKAF